MISRRCTEFRHKRQNAIRGIGSCADEGSFIGSYWTYRPWREFRQSRCFNWIYIELSNTGRTRSHVSFGSHILREEKTFKNHGKPQKCKARCRAHLFNCSDDSIGPAVPSFWSVLVLRIMAHSTGRSSISHVAKVHCDELHQ